VRIIC